MALAPFLEVDETFFSDPFLTRTEEGFNSLLSFSRSRVDHMVPWHFPAAACLGPPGTNFHFLVYRSWFLHT